MPRWESGLIRSARDRLRYTKTQTKSTLGSCARRFETAFLFTKERTVGKKTSVQSVKSAGNLLPSAPSTKKKSIKKKK